MKKLIILISAVLLLVVLAGCDFLGGSGDPESLVRDFEDALNVSSRESFHLYFDPNGSLYDQSKAADYWETFFPNAEKNYQIENIQIYGSSGTALISSETSWNKDEMQMAFVTDEHGDVYFSSMIISGTRIFE